MSRRGRPAIVGLLIVAAAGACFELGGPTSGVVSISSLTIPSPSVVIGDVMRDSLGVATPLGVTAFDPDGHPIPGEHITWFAIDSTLKVDTVGLVRGIIRDTNGGRVAAGAGSLQTLPQRIIVSVKPENVVNSTTGSTAIAFDPNALDSTKSSNWSTPLAVTVNGGGTTKAQGFIVTYELRHTPPPLNTGTPTAYIGDDAARATSRDTTDRLGVASRRAILRTAFVDPAVLAGTKPDSIVIRATVTYLGVNLPGSPIDYIIPIKQKP